MENISPLLFLSEIPLIRVTMSEWKPNFRNRDIFSLYFKILSSEIAIFSRILPCRKQWSLTVCRLLLLNHKNPALCPQSVLKVKVKCSRYRPGVAQRLGRGIALLLLDRGTRRGWVVSSTPRTHFTPGKDPVTIVQEAGWAPGSVWTGGKSRPHRDSIPDRPVRSQSLYRLSYRAHTVYYV